MNLTHLDKDGNITMVDIGDKIATARTASAQGKVVFAPDVYRHIKDTDGMTKKGSIIQTAHIAGIMAGKKTHELIPLCHALPLDTIKMSFRYADDECAIVVGATAKVTHKTGVEMEALTAVSVARLTIYDMTKAISHDITITDIHLVQKTGGNLIMTNNNQPFDTISLTVLYFASLAEQAGKDSETVQVDSDDLTVIYAKLSAKYGFDLPQDKVAVAINHEFGSWGDGVSSGDTIAFIPPVAGGLYENGS